MAADQIMKKKEHPAQPARYRPTLGTKIHYLAWTLIILALWPLGWLFGKGEKLRRYE